MMYRRTTSLFLLWTYLWSPVVLVTSFHNIQQQQHQQQHNKPYITTSYSSRTNRFTSSLLLQSSRSSSNSMTEEVQVVEPSDVVNAISSTGLDEAKKWGEMFGFEGCVEEDFFALFRGIRDLQAKDGNVLGIAGAPFYLDAKTVKEGTGLVFESFFTFDDLTVALKEDFLDADRGSTDNKKGWKVSRVSTPRDSSFEGARMNLDQVRAAMEKGTIIFNAIGAHIPKLAGATLACCDATSLPNAINMYVTAANQRTSAPPHTDRQDVVIVQSTGSKHWRVYSPPTPSLKPNSDPLARGKGDDNLPLFALEDLGSKLLLNVVLKPGDILFVPAGFPHTTDTVTDNENPETSIHLTFNLDTHVWDLDYLSLRRIALKRAGVMDSVLEQISDTDNRYIGKVNMLPYELRNVLMKSLPMGLLEEDDNAKQLVEQVVNNLSEISHKVDESTACAVEGSSLTIWRDTVNKVRQQGIELYDIHRDMYLAAKDEGDLRKAEAQMTAHLDDKPLPMTPERMQRLSLFRVQRYFEKINVAKESLVEWTKQGNGNADSDELPANWAFTLPVKVGDSVEADLGGAWFPATVTKAGSRYGVEFFDGEEESGLERSALKLLTPPTKDEGSMIDGVDTSKMTKKELKKFLKKLGTKS